MVIPIRAGPLGLRAPVQRCRRDQSTWHVRWTIRRCLPHDPSNLRARRDPTVLEEHPAMADQEELVRRCRCRDLDRDSHWVSSPWLSGDRPGHTCSQWSSCHDVCGVSRGGPLQEEPGWRGYALPRLQRQHHPVIAALIVGVLHCGWHAPLFLTEEWDTARQDPSQYVAYLILVVSLSFILSWIANGTRGSIFLVILGHNSVNWGFFAAGTFTGGEVMSNWPAALGLAVLASIVLAATRGRLGYQQSAQMSSPSVEVQRSS